MHTLDAVVHRKDSVHLQIGTAIETSHYICIITNSESCTINGCCQYNDWLVYGTTISNVTASCETRMQEESMQEERMQEERKQTLFMSA
jgi:hypothetical protein